MTKALADLQDVTTEALRAFGADLLGTSYEDMAKMSDEEILALEAQIQLIGDELHRREPTPLYVTI